MPAFPPSHLDANQCIQGAYDENASRLRVDATITATVADVIIHSSESSITIGNPNNGNTLNVHADGSIDVNTILNSGTDSVTVFQGTSPWVVSGTITTSPNVNIHDGTGVSISSTGSSLNVDVTNTVPISAVSLPLPAGASTSALQTAGNASLTSIDSKLTSPITVTGPLTDTQLRATPVPISGTITANQGTSPWVTSVSNFPATQPVSGTVAVTQSTTPWVDNITQFGNNPVVTGTGASGAGIPRVTVSNDSNILATQSGTWNINNITGTVSLPTGASTSTNQTNGNQKTQIVDGAGTVVGPEQTISGTNYLPVVLAASATSGSSLVARSIQIAGSDGTNAQTLKTDTAGHLLTGLVAPPVGTVTQAGRTIGTTAVRATVTGSAPLLTRTVLAITADAASTAKFYIGSATVTSSGATAGIQFTSSQPVVFSNDAADYYIISDTAAQTVYFMEQV